MSVAEPLKNSDLVDEWQQLNFVPEKLAINSGLYLKTANYREKGRIQPLIMTLKQSEALLNPIGKTLATYFYR